MTLSSAQLQAKLIALMRSSDLGTGSVPPQHAYSSDCHKKLSRHQINDAVFLLSRYLGMYGSGGNVDMYRLNQAYLLDPSMRQRFNELLREWRFPD